MGDEFEYINRAYRLSMGRGTRVRYTPDGVASKASGRLGTVTGAEGAYLRIRMDGDSFSLLYHPKWELEVITDELTARSEQSGE